MAWLCLGLPAPARAGWSPYMTVAVQGRPEITEPPFLVLLLNPSVVVVPEKLAQNQNSKLQDKKKYAVHLEVEIIKIHDCNLQDT